MARFLVLISLFSLFACLQAEKCLWKSKESFGLDTKSLDVGAILVRLSNISDSNSCQMACCEREDCQLAMMGTPADEGTPECFLVTCVKDGKDVCILQPTPQFNAFLKTRASTRQLPDDAPVSTGTDHCMKPSDPGMCRAAFPKFYYDPSTGSCIRFIYGGCGGNKNRFDSEAECMESCGGQTVASFTPKPRKADSVSTPKISADHCMKPSDPGMCRAAFPKFYYDPSTGSCSRFIYGGCGGNKNRFDSEDECMESCGGQEAHFHGRGMTPDRWTPAFFLVATVAVICALLLVGLMTISVHKFKWHRLAHHDDQQDLLPDDDLLDASCNHSGRA